MCTNRAIYKHEIAELLYPFRLEGADLSQPSAIIHLASKIRGSDIDILNSNRDLTKQLLNGLERLKPGIFVHANSIRSGDNSAFGQSKAEMAQQISQKCEELGWNFFDIKLPNIFGERARPFHNSFIASVIASLHENVTYQVLDNPLDLMSAHDVAKYLLDLCGGQSERILEFERTTISEVVKKLEAYHEVYKNNVIPELKSLFELRLFNAYRFYSGPRLIKLSSHRDPRGSLIELANFEGNSSTIFTSETNQGFSRGHHFHIDKFERFIVAAGSGVIEVQELYSNKSFRFEVTGDEPCAVDIPTLSAHKLSNFGSEKLFCIFMSMPKFDAEMPDTYRFDF